MECLFIFMLCCGWQSIVKSSVAAALQTASSSSIFSNKNIFPFGLAGVAGLALRSEPAVHSKTWHNVHANAIDIEHVNKYQPMLIPTNNDPMAMDAVGFSILWRDSS